MKSMSIATVFFSIFIQRIIGIANVFSSPVLHNNVPADIVDITL